MGMIVWLHGGSLSCTDPALQANPNAPAIFVFDAPFLRNNRIAFPRLQLMFEAATEALLGREHRVCVGEQALEIAAFAKEHGCSSVHASNIPSPELQRTVAALKNMGLEVVLHEVPRLTRHTGPVKRFSAFWRKVEREVWQA